MIERQKFENIEKIVYKAKSFKQFNNFPDTHI